MEGLFDREFDYSQFGQNLDEDLTGKTFHVCTVRQPTVGDLPIGDLFWLLEAAKARKRGAQVVITDFYDRPGGYNKAVLELMYALNLAKSGDYFSKGEISPARNVIFRKAEDVPRNIQAWERFCDYVRSHKDERSEWQFAGNTDEGADSVMQAEDYSVPENMNRFLEELSVWVDSIDGDAVQLLNHEKETTEWVRRTYPESKKEFWRVTLPFINEFRGKYREVAKTGEMQIFERRIKDWAEKLILGPGDSQPEEQTAFYRHLFEELVQFFQSISSVDGSFRDAEVAEDLFNVDPKLVPLFVNTCGDESVDKIKYKLFGSYVSWKDRDDVKRKRRRYIDGISIMGKQVLKQEKPDLSVLYKPSLVAVADTESLNHPFFKVLLMSDTIDINELARFWIFMIEKSDLSRHRMIAHPISGKIAQSASLDPSLWSLLKGYYIELLGNSWAIKNPLSVPAIKRILDELLAEDPDTFFGMAFRKLLYLASALQDDGEYLREGISGDELIFLEYIATKYLSSGAQKFREEALELQENIKKAHIARRTDRKRADRRRYKEEKRKASNPL